MNRRQVIAVAGVASFACLLGLLLNWQGAGLMSDSTSYFKFPRSLQWNDLPVHHGVLYALLLGGLRSAGFELLRAAQIVNVVSLVLLAVVLSTQPRRDACWIALLTILSLPVLTTYSTALSEPVFLVLTAHVLTRLRPAIEKSDVRNLLILALVAGVATVTRYSGVALIGAMGLLVLLFWRGRSRWGMAFTAGFVSVLPLLAVMVWNHFRVGSATNRTIAWHFIPPESWQLFSNTLATWWVPYKVTELLPVAGIVLVVAVVAGPALIAALVRRDATQVREAAIPLVYFYGYLAFIGLSICVADISIMPDNRMLSPLMLCVWPLAFTLFRALQGAAVRVAARAVLILLAGMMSVRAMGFTKDAFLNGREYSARAWRESAAIRLLGALGDRVPVFTNASDADELLHGGHAEAVPWEFHATSMLPRPDFTNRFERMRELLAHSNAVVVRADVRYWPPYLVAEAKIRTCVPDLRSVELPDGCVYLRPGHPLLPLVETYARKP